MRTADPELDIDRFGGRSRVKVRSPSRVSLADPEGRVGRFESAVKVASAAGARFGSSFEERRFGGGTRAWRVGFVFIQRQEGIGAGDGVRLRERSKALKGTTP
jgi:hypothetical protein